jgi:hypothetical protein
MWHIVSRHWNGGWQKNKDEKAGITEDLTEIFLLQQLAVYGIINV